MPNKKKYLILHGSSIYSASVTPDHSARLFYSRYGDAWTESCRGKSAVSLFDDGNGVDVKFTDGPELRLDYSQAAELRMILGLVDDVNYKKLKL